MKASCLFAASKANTFSFSGKHGISECFKMLTSWVRKAIGASKQQLAPQAHIVGEDAGSPNNTIPPLYAKVFFLVLLQHSSDEYKRNASGRSTMYLCYYIFISCCERNTKEIRIALTSEFILSNVCCSAYSERRHKFLDVPIFWLHWACIFYTIEMFSGIQM